MLILARPFEQYGPARDFFCKERCIERGIICPIVTVAASPFYMDNPNIFFCYPQDPPNRSLNGVNPWLCTQRVSLSSIHCAAAADGPNEACIWNGR